MLYLSPALLAHVVFWIMQASHCLAFVLPLAFNWSLHDTGGGSGNSGKAQSIGVRTLRQTPWDAVFFALWLDHDSGAQIRGGGFDGFYTCVSFVPFFLSSWCL